MFYASKSFVPEHDLQEANVCFLGIPFDSTALSISNQRFGSVHIRTILKNSISYIPEKKTNPLKDLKIFDAGDVDVVLGSFEKTSERVKDTLKSIFEKNPKVFLLSLGGEHSITLPIVEFLKPKTIIQLDAHMDLEKDYQGELYAHNTWAYHALNKLNCKIVQIGVRSFSEEEEKIAKKFEIKNKIENLKEPVYLTVDMDVFDPSHAPDVGFPEPSGLSPSEVFQIIDQVFKHKVIGMDVVEIASDRLNNQTANLAAKLILRTLSNL